jgi:Domain of unknown function (DUF3850)
MSTHELRTWPAPFEAVWQGTKLHEIRRKDRPFAVGDYLLLREYDPRREVNDRYTGRAVRVFITYISEPGSYGLPDMLCVLSIAGVTHMFQPPAATDPLR